MLSPSEWMVAWSQFLCLYTYTVNNFVYAYIYVSHNSCQRVNCPGLAKLQLLICAMA